MWEILEVFKEIIWAYDLTFDILGLEWSMKNTEQREKTLTISDIRVIPFLASIAQKTIFLNLPNFFPLHYYILLLFVIARLIWCLSVTSTLTELRRAHIMDWQIRDTWNNFTWSGEVVVNAITFQIAFFWFCQRFPPQGLGDDSEIKAVYFEVWYHEFNTCCCPNYEP